MTAGTARPLPVLLVLLLGLLGLLAPVPVAVAPAAAQERDEGAVRVLLSTIAPHAPQDGDVLTLAGQLVNTGDEPVRSLRVRVRVAAEPLISRSALAQADATGARTERVGRGVRLPEEPLPPGERVPFTLAVEVDDLGLDRDGVYPLHVEVQGGTGESGPRSLSLGRVETFLPWFEEPVTGTTRIAWLWPLVAPPAQAPRLTEQGPLLLDGAAVGEDLATSFTDAGRLGGLLRAARAAEQGACPPLAEAPCRGEQVPVTYAVDPDLLLAAQGMSDGYDLRLSEQRTEPGPGAEDARRWLDELRAALTTGSELLALPYADVDVASLAGTPLERDVDPAVEIGARTAALTTGVEPVDGLGWAPPGPVPPDALGAYRLAGVRTLVVDELALPPRPVLQSRTSTARAPLRTATGRLGGLVADAGLSRLLAAPEPGSETWQGARVAEQRFLVETAILAAEAPEDTRTIVVAPPRDVEVVPAVAAAALLDSGRVPWLCPVLLSEAAAGTETCPSAATPGGDLAAPPEDRGAPVLADPEALRLGPRQLETVTEARAAVDLLTLDVLAQSDEAAETRVRLLRGAFRAESVAWRDAPRAGRLLARLLADDVGDLLGRIALLTPDAVTLTSSRGGLFVTVENTLDQAVDVRVELGPATGTRLATVVSDVVSVPGRNSVQVQVDAEPRTSGQFPVRARLLDRDGDPFGPSSEFLLRSTRYGAVALAVTGVAAGVLLLVAGVRLVRRALGGETGSFGRRRRRELRADERVPAP